MWGREMRAALLFVLASLLVGAAIREWRRSNETRFQDLVASLEAGEGRTSEPAPDAQAPDPGQPSRAAGARDGGGHRPAGAGRGNGPRPASLDPDRATAAEWERLPGIGPALAERIVKDRATRGPFGGPDGLLRVRGIGPRTLARFRAFLVDARPESLRPPHPDPALQSAPP